jgi:hypothetical protein
LKKTLYVAAALMLGAAGANACGLRAETETRLDEPEPPCKPQPTIVTTFSKGLIINTPSLNTPGRPVITTEPFGYGAIINSTGQETRICRSFGDNSMICR